MTKRQQVQQALIEISTETPFNKRRHCWFCGEPNQLVFSCPSNKVICKSTGQHNKPFSLPSCAECYQVAQSHIASADQQVLAFSIWTVRAAVKHYLLKQYQKDLAIGINWTQAELVDSEFEQGNFAGFQKSAWFMYEVAKERLSYVGWPLIVGGENLVDDYQGDYFSFDGVIYPNIEQAIHHYCKTFSLNHKYFHSVLALLGAKQFAKAVRFCRLLVGTSHYEHQQALLDLTLEQANDESE